MSADQGPDGVAALCYMSYQMHMVVELAWDPSHGVWNDLKNGLKFAGLFDHLLLSLLRLNVPVGPWHEDLRYKECLQGLQELLEFGKPEDSPLFQAFVNEMIEEEGGQDCQEHEDPAKAMWEKLKISNPFSTKGTKVSIGRFMDCLRVSRKELKQWAQR